MAGISGSRDSRNTNAATAETFASSEDDLLEDIENPLSDIEAYSKEVLQSLIEDNLQPSPNNFSLYFDRLLEDKSVNLKKEIVSMLELEESNEAESTIALENSLKQGFSSVKNILGTAANLYKNMSLMSKILAKRKKELEDSPGNEAVANIAVALEHDIVKLNALVKQQSTQMKSSYDETANIIKNAENETIFDNKFGVYNKRYLMTKMEQEIGLVEEFQHKSSLIFIELSRDLIESVNNEKAVLLMTRTIARLLLKTSRRSDIVAHYGNGVFAMLLKHTNIESAEQASERLSDLVLNSNFFLSDKEIKLQIAIGITDIDAIHSAEEIVVAAMSGIEKSYKDEEIDYAVELLN